MYVHVNLCWTQNVATRNTREGKGAGQPGTQATKVINQETQVRKLFVGAGGFYKWHMVSLSSLDQNLLKGNTFLDNMIYVEEYLILSKHS